ncbi:BTB/POZ domain-containing protein 6-B-like isoform X2 [Argiope bruennichi]|uniref:BTB/POZ domain-containing protein 6-B-like isoform X2 n=1 Tax=Argiope bruennichi TaxID=94029 RepID=UPI002495481E|nr:BTB/POZ domain-containing protein 6-B-like isoform X2 [Argiope bruennichi]
MKENPEAYKLELDMEDEKSTTCCAFLCPCRPRVKDSENGGVAWRRKSSSKHPRRRSSTPPTPRPTLLLPPMRCTGTALCSDTATTAPVVTTRVQHREPAEATYLTLENSSHTQQLPQPSAPSPGHLFYNSEDHSDITFIVGQEEWRFPAHSFILSKTRPTLSALLKAAHGDQAEELMARLSSVDVQSEPVTPVVLKLPNLQPEVFEQMLRYIYTGHVTLLTVDSTLRLLHPSRVYHLPLLTTHCLSHISKNVNTSNVLIVLSHLLCPEVHHPCNDSAPLEECHDNDNERNELVFKCFLIIDHHADDVLQSELFETLELELMVEIVKRDTLQVSSEAVVFDSVMRWACRACKKQRKELTSENKCSVLGKALYLVRYLTMTPEEFLRGPVSHGILCKEDKDLFLSKLNNPTSTSVGSLPDRWNGWKIAEKRQPHQNLLSLSSPEVASSNNVDLTVMPSNSVQPVNTNVKRTERKKKSMSKKLLNGVGDLVICVIQLLD